MFDRCLSITKNGLFVTVNPRQAERDEFGIPVADLEGISEGGVELWTAVGVDGVVA